MNVGALIALLKLAQDTELIGGPRRTGLYTKETALYKAETGLGL